MELVDANTKNFLYLTLSQYNDELNPVRMRVSMRRDQPFWGGGNSFIACESFRISAAPNPGGLYYKIIPHSWYIGATVTEPVKIAKDDTGVALPSPFEGVEVPSEAAWTAMGGDHDPRYSQKHPRANIIIGNNIANAGADPQYSSLSFKLGVGSKKIDGTDADDFFSADPEIILEHVGRFLNHYNISKGSWIKLITDGNGKDGTSKGYAIGQIDQVPSLQVTGGGFGVDGMSFPEFTITNVAACQASIGHHPPIIAQDHTLRPPFVMDISLVASNPGPTQLTEFWSNLGQGIQSNVTQVGMWPGPANNAHLAARNRWYPILQGMEFLRFFCPAGCELRGQNNMFVGQPGNATIANVPNAIPKFPITWSGPFEVGTEFTMRIPSSYATSGGNGGVCNGLGGLVPGQTYHGIVKAVSDSVAAAGPTASLLAYMTDDTYSQLENNQTLNGTALAFVGGRDLCLGSANTISKSVIFGTINPNNNGAYTYGDRLVIPRTIGADLTISVVKQHNLNSPPFGGFEGRTDALQFVLGQTTDNLIMRRPALNEDFYCYTPNEFFYAFNKPLYADHSTETDLPFMIQTDENGGFVIRWRNVDPKNPSSELIVSNTLLTELGLNAWFEYEVDTLQSIDTKDMYYVKRSQVDETQSTASLFRWIKRTDLSNHIPSKVFHPPQNPPDIGFVLYDRNGDPWIYVDHKVIEQKKFTSVTRRIYPDMETDEFDQDYFIWRDLPESGRITNTQQVSIESFATFSEITIVIPNLPFQPMLGTSTDERILASLRMPFVYSTNNEINGQVESTAFSYYGDLIFNTEASRSYLKVTTDQQLYDCDCEVRLIERDGTMHVMELPYKGEFQIKLRMLQTQ